MKYLSLILLVIFVFPIMAQNDTEHTIQHDGQVREYLVHTPIGYSTDKDYPLIINMHGLGSSRSQQQLYSQFDRVADTAGVIMVYPQGLEANVQGQIQTHWNAGFGTGVDDVGFLTNMLDQIFIDYSVDEKKIYSTGMSNGGFMSYYLACRATDRVVAVASVTGSMTLSEYRGCQPSEPIPAMQIHGTADLVVPFRGNPTIDEVVEFWVDHNECDVMPTEEMIPDTDPNDNTTTTRIIYDGCENKGEVWYYVVDNGGHTWPGTFPVPLLGNTSGDFFASEHIWEFFKQFPANTTSIDQVKFQDGKVYPNPAMDQIHVESANVPILIATDVLGQQFQLPSIGDEGWYDINHLPAGSYYLIDGKRRYSFVKK